MIWDIYQQFVTLLLVLDHICTFASSVDEMVDHIEIVFNWLKSFNLKIKPRKCLLSQYSVVFLGYVLSAGEISVNTDKVEKVKNWLMPTNY